MFDAAMRANATSGAEPALPRGICPVLATAGSIGPAVSGACSL